MRISATENENRIANTTFALRFILKQESARLRKYHTYQSQEDGECSARRICSLVDHQKFHIYPRSVLRQTDVDPRKLWSAAANPKTRDADQVVLVGGGVVARQGPTAVSLRTTPENALTNLPFRKRGRIKSEMPPHRQMKIKCGGAGCLDLGWNSVLCQCL